VKKYLPYLFALLLLTGMIFLFMSGRQNNSKKLNEKITFRRQDTNPYGSLVAYAALPYMFPEAKIMTSKGEPGYWDSLSEYKSKQALIIVIDHFAATSDEMDKLINFASSGNTVFVSARSLSESATDRLKCATTTRFDIPEFEKDENGNLLVKDDSLRVRLRKPYFDDSTLYFYPGRKFSSAFSSINYEIAEELGSDENGHTNFIHLRAGRGHFYVHLAPLAFSNYFLLFRKNIRYYEQLFSGVDSSLTKVVWDEYYAGKGADNARRNRSSRNKGWLSALWSYPAFRAAMLVGIFTLLAYVLLEMRRKQRPIPVVTRPRNDSLDFVKTIGRLYYDRADHRNLGRKMSSYFLEHVRSAYKIPTSNLDDRFVQAVQFKTGVPEGEIRSIVSYIKYIDETPQISSAQLNDFFRQLETFYQKA